MNNSLLDKIFVISLKECVSRKTHIVNEFLKYQIKNYEFFEAINKDSEEINDLLSSIKLKKFPPCFRCYKNVCNCKNNYLLDTHIANWCSYIKLMKKIVNSNYNKLIMICEDDIKFTKNGYNILNNIIQHSTLNQYDINLNNPVLIRVGSAFKDIHHKLKIIPILLKRVMMSNPSFIINKKYAESFLKNLKIIEKTSDVFIHKYILKLDESIQDWTVFPQPIYELSYNNNTTEFESTILNNENINKRKMIYKKFLFIGHSRCGTCSISNYINQMKYEVGHETMKQDGTSSWMMAVDDKYPYGNIDITQNYFFQNIILVTRNPFEAIPSIIIENKYSPRSESYYFKIKHIKKILDITLPELDYNKLNLIDEIEIACKSLIYWYQICELRNPDIICKIEDIYPLKKFNKYNLKISNQKFNSNKKYAGKNYIKPKISIDLYNKINIDIKKELKIFCNKYGYKFILDI